jgi:hypothetical protein
MAHKETHALDTPVGAIVTGFFLFGLAYWLHTDLAALESGARESIRVNRLVALAYHFSGHWPTVGIFALGAVFYLVKGVRLLGTTDSPGGR